MRVVKDNLKKSVLKCLKQNKSLNQISRELNLNKTTVYYWYKKLGKSKITKINIKKDNENLIGEFIGIFAGDGNYYLDKDYHHSITIYIDSKDKKYISHVKQVILNLFSKNPNIINRKDDNTTYIRIRSKDAHLFIKNYLTWKNKKSSSICLRNDIKHYSNEFLKGFICGLFDTDGFIDKDTSRAVFGTISNSLVTNVEEVFSLFNIKYTKNVHIDKRGNRKPLSHINVSRKDIDKFFNLINPIH